MTGRSLSELWNRKSGSWSSFLRYSAALKSAEIIGTIDTIGDDGPEKGAPALLAAGMMGDRAEVIFADPEEISRSIAPEC